MKNTILISLLIISFGVNVYLISQAVVQKRHENVLALTNKISDIENSKIKLQNQYEKIKESFLELARSKQKILGVLMKKTDLRKEFSAYQDLNKEEFEEAVRRKIVKLGLQIEQLEKYNQ